MSPAPKTYLQLERHVKGVANHRRIEILFYLDKYPGATLEEICELIKSHIATASEHSARLARAGLINKRYEGTSVKHSLSPYGRTFVKFLRSFQRWPTIL